jgi:hypothetical protein
VAQDRIVLLPGGERTHRVIGPYKSHAYTTCAPGLADTCRTWTVHQFEMACGGWRVRWLDVVAARGDRRITRAGRDRLSLLVEPTWLSLSRGLTEPTVVFPQGYAPAIGFPVRFVGAPAPTVVSQRGPKAEPIDRPVAPVAMPTTPVDVPARIDAAATPVGEVGEVTRALAAAGWVTTVVPAVTDGSGPGLWRAASAVGLIGAMWGAVVVLRRRGRRATEAPPPVRPEPGRDDTAATCAALIARAVDLHRVARDALPAVPRPSVRNVLADDLARVQRVLLSPELTASIADGSWDRVEPVVTAALADLERIARIIAGVLETAWPEQTPPVAASAAPVTIAEAYEVLGVNPQADGKLAKKVVDALRLSWHPDHASDDADRARRETRMKQINAAWDMICSATAPPEGRTAA